MGQCRLLFHPLDFLSSLDGLLFPRISLSLQPSGVQRILSHIDVGQLASVIFLRFLRAGQMYCVGWQGRGRVLGQHDRRRLSPRSQRLEDSLVNFGRLEYQCIVVCVLMFARNSVQVA